MERARMTLRDFLEDLSKMSPTPIEYIKPGGRSAGVPTIGRSISTASLISTALTAWRPL